MTLEELEEANSLIKSRRSILLRIEGMKKDVQHPVYIQIRGSNYPLTTGTQNTVYDLALKDFKRNLMKVEMRLRKLGVELEANRGE